MLPDCRCSALPHRYLTHLPKGLVGTPAFMATAVFDSHVASLASAARLACKKVKGTYNATNLFIAAGDVG